MQRRDVLRGVLLLAANHVCASTGICRPLLHRNGPLAYEAGFLLVVMERDAGYLPVVSGKIWRLPAQQWLQPKTSAVLLQEHAGMPIFSVLDAANHCLMREALRRHGGIFHHEQRCLLATRWRYLLHATA